MVVFFVFESASVEFPSRLLEVELAGEDESVPLETSNWLKGISDAFLSEFAVLVCSFVVFAGVLAKNDLGRGPFNGKSVQ